MSGAKRRTKYRKQVESDCLESLPEPRDGELVVEMVGARGGNILEVRSAAGDVALCRLPSKFRQLVWVKRGSFLIVSMAAEDFVTASGKKGAVLFDARHVLYPDQIKHLHERGLWPAKFESAVPRRRSEQAAALAADVTRGSSGDGAHESSAVLPPESERRLEDRCEGGEEDEYYDTSDDDRDLFQNNNRRGGFISEESEDEDEDG